MLLLLAEMFLPERKRARVSRDGADRTVGQDARQRVPTAHWLLRFWFCHGRRASPASALREYNAGNYTNALQEFEQLAK